MLRKYRNGQWSVFGDDCDKGPDYSLEELFFPRRVLTTTIALAGGRLPLLPVRLSESLPKETLFDCLHVLSCMEGECPVAMGDVIVRDILDNGIDIIATRSV